MRIVELITILDEPEYIDAWSEVWCWAVRSVTGNGSRIAQHCIVAAIHLSEFCANRGVHESL